MIISMITMLVVVVVERCFVVVWWVVMGALQFFAHRLHK